MKKDRKLLLIVTLFLITLLAVFIAVWALFFKDSAQQPLIPDHVPEIENNAEQIPDDNDQSNIPKNGGSVNLTYSKSVTVDLKNKNVNMLFANPGKSSHNIVLQIVVQDTVIVQSGAIKPKNQVKILDLLPGVDKRLSVGNYDGQFIIAYYDQNTGEKATLDTKLPIDIIVK